MNYDIFQNSDFHILFVPGSCGSSDSIPNYVRNNPNTDLRAASNTSTGRGQVTNVLMSMFIETNSKTKFEDLLAKYSGRIKDAGGDPHTIKIRSKGEKLLEEAYSGVGYSSQTSKAYLGM